MTNQSRHATTPRDARLHALIDRYLDAVRQAVALIVETGISRPASNIEWVTNAMVQIGELRGGVEYFKHGFGCIVRLKDGPVDFDFGDSGQIDGFALSRLLGFAGSRLQLFGYARQVELKNAFASAVLNGEFQFSGDILYYRLPA